MADAFQCDRCGEFRQGSGSQIRVGERVGQTLTGETIDYQYRAELCESCCDRFGELVDEFRQGGERDREDADDEEDADAEDDGEPDTPEETEGGEDGFSCPECDYTSTSQRGLSIHQAKAHDDDDPDPDGGEETDETATGGDRDDDQEGDVDDVTFADVAPAWLDERSWHEAVAMSEDLDELAETLGWDDRDRLQEVLDATGAGDELAQLQEVGSR